jgi:hypothetical protein
MIRKQEKVCLRNKKRVEKKKVKRRLELRVYREEYCVAIIAKSGSLRRGNLSRAVIARNEAIQVY